MASLKRKDPPAAAAAEPPAKQAKSLDDTEIMVAALAASEITWFEMEPKHRNDIEIVQPGGNFGVKCNTLDVERWNSPFFQTLLACAAKDGDRRIEVPEGTFASLDDMCLFTKYFSCAEYFNQISTRSHSALLKAAFALDLWRHPRVTRLKARFVDRVTDVSTDDCLVLGKRYQMPELVNNGVRRLVHTGVRPLPDNVWTDGRGGVEELLYQYNAVYRIASGAVGHGGDDLDDIRKIMGIKVPKKKTKKTMFD